MAVLCVDALDERPVAIGAVGGSFTTWELTEAAEGTGVV